MGLGLGREKTGVPEEENSLRGPPYQIRKSPMEPPFIINLFSFTGYGRDQGRYSDGYRGGMGVTFKDNKQFGQNQNRFAALSDQGRAGKSAQQLQVKDMSPSEVL